VRAIRSEQHRGASGGHEVTLGVTALIVRDDAVLLVLREDFEVWSMPGGMVADHELPEAAVCREVTEETAVAVAVQRLAGITRRTGSGTPLVTLLYVCSHRAGSVAADGGETLDAAYHPLRALPTDMFWWHRREIQMCGVEPAGAVYLEHVVAPPFQVTSREELYRARDASGLARSDFYREYFCQAE
jgi:ADP-ribose pyrophosphatase YjhB (NUDIX family)